VVEGGAGGVPGARGATERWREGGRSRGEQGGEQKQIVEEAAERLARWQSRGKMGWPGRWGSGGELVRLRGG